MFRMDTSTKGVFYTGLFAWLGTFGVGVISFTNLQENHDVRIATNERTAIKQADLIERLRLGISRNREDSVRIVSVLDKVDNTQREVIKVLTGVKDMVTRIETIQEIKEDN